MHDEIFRQSTGLIFGQSSGRSRFITQNQSDFSPKDFRERSRLMGHAQLNKEHFENSNGIIFGGENSPVGPGRRGKRTTSNDAYGAGIDYQQATAHQKRDLFQPTDGFRLGYIDSAVRGDASPRYSDKSRKINKFDSYQNGALEAGSEPVDEEWEEYSGRGKRQRKKRQKRNSRYEKNVKLQQSIL